MSGFFLRPENSPFTQQQAEALNQLLATLSPDQTLWLSGYLAGLRQGATGATGATGGKDQRGAALVREGSHGAGSLIDREVTILFGSQTGNAQRLAGDMKKRMEEKGFAVTLSCMSEFRSNSLKKVKQLLIVVSTYGEGDPPDKAALFHEFVHGKRAPRLEGTRFSVLALGDQLYDNFCKTGKDFDAHLEELGATRIHPRVDCDVDFDEPAKTWMDGVLDALTGKGNAQGPIEVPDQGQRRIRATPPNRLSPASFRQYRRPARRRPFRPLPLRRIHAQTPSPPRCWRTSASTAAVPTRRPVTSSCPSRVPGSALNRATPWASTRTTIRNWSTR